MKESSCSGTIGVVVVSCLIALGIDYPLPQRPKVKRVLPMIGIAVNATTRFFAIWIVSALVVFMLSIVLGVLRAGNYER